MRQKEYQKIYQKKYRKEHKEKAKEYQKEYRKNNKEKMKQCYENNKEKINKKSSNYHNNRYKIDIKFNLNSRMATAINHSLKGNKKGRRWEILVGYTCEQLKKHLKKTMPKGYTWQDYLEGGLHIDHKIPISKFNYTSTEHIDFKRCWSLSNLQLLPEKENRKKHDTLTEPFQPTLAI